MLDKYGIYDKLYCRCCDDNTHCQVLIHAHACNEFAKPVLLCDLFQSCLAYYLLPSPKKDGQD